MHKLLFIVVSSFTLTAQATSYFECDSVQDPFVTKACASPTTVEKARKFNASYQQVFAQSPSYDAVKPAVKIKNDYRLAVSGCPASPDISGCLDAALDQANSQLSSAYAFATDPLTLESNALKESAHKNASLLKDQARKTPAQCLRDEAKRLDDNVSPAGDIAQGVAQACKSKAVEFATFANDTLILWDVLNPISRMNSEQVNDMSERSFGVQAATKVVLEARVEKYKTEANKPKAKKKKRKSTTK